MMVFRLSLAVAALLMTLPLGGQTAVAAEAEHSSPEALQQSFLRFDAPGRQEEATALLHEFSAESAANFRHAEGIPGSDAIQRISFDKDNESRVLEQWPDQVLRYSGGSLYLRAF